MDGFQGQEREVVILSLVRSNLRGEVGFLRDHRRLNVAVTRARRHITIIGDSRTVSTDKFVSSLLDHAEKHGEVRFATDVEDDVGGEEEETIVRFEKKKQEKKSVNILKQIQDFARKSNAESDELKRLRMFLRFPRSLSNVDRKKAHEECERLGLTSTSRGSGSFRSVTVQPRARVIIDDDGVGKKDVKKVAVVVEEERVKEDEEKDVKKERVKEDEDEEIPEAMHPIKIKIRCKGKSHELEFQCAYRSTLMDLRMRLEEFVPLHQQKLIFKGKKWLPNAANDARSLSSLGLKNGSRLMLMAGDGKLVTSKASNRHVVKTESQTVVSNASAASRLREASKARIARNRSKKRANKKLTAQNRTKREDMETLDAAATQQGRCAFRGCTFKSASLFGLLCSECRQQFCPKHQLPESHGCGSNTAREGRLRARKAAERIRATGRAAPPAPLPEWKRNALRRQLHKKIDEKSSSRTGVSSSEARKKRKKKKTKKPPGV